MTKKYLKGTSGKAGSFEQVFSRGKYLLFWEAAEGGAGVLSQILEDQTSFQKLAREALDICHFLEPKDSCAQACYQCLLSYRNQFDHPYLNRHLISGFLRQLQNSQVNVEQDNQSGEEHYRWLLEQTDPNSEFERVVLKAIKDATFELMDSILTTRNASCLAEFSLSPLFQRKWSSTYEALQDSRPNRNKLMRRYVEEIPSLEYVLLAIDHTAWGRRGAKTLKDRTYQHQASSNNSVTVGQGYSTIAWLPENQGSWALPLRHERITSYETPIAKAAWQLKKVCQHIQQKVSSFMVGLGWETVFRAKGDLVSICSSFWSRSLVSICQAETSLDFTQFEYATAMSKMERFNAFNDLAVVASQRFSPRKSSALAISSAQINPWKSCTVYLGTFSRDWFTNYFSQTSWKVSWVENWSQKKEKKDLSYS